MEFVICTKDYMDYIKLAAEKIAEEREYITSLDSATGDGDHWANINMGFQALVDSEENLKDMPIDEALKNIGMIMMNKVGGSSGILYGGAYMMAGMKIKGQETLNIQTLFTVLETMCEDMMKRGNAKPGYKTMIDALYPAVEAYRSSLEQKKSIKDLFSEVKKAAEKGAESTKNMEAVKGRASYMKNKGVGHLDPGAVTMAYQITAMCECFYKNI